MDEVTQQWKALALFPCEHALLPQWLSLIRFGLWIDDVDKAPKLAVNSRWAMHPP